jgi:hypothetical protein
LILSIADSITHLNHFNFRAVFRAAANRQSTQGKQELERSGKILPLLVK